ncbi:Gfo/Idh/MocA family protein [Microbacterium sp. SA39]|uniref:Gfo/Idh/MocA family protein n=1 Tax=Microbacterium sp. SA39 TaxID=1263625 RepID=UPI0005FA5C56|nr:Gfo/Idh/MocA family oxidoreductase [Microbacterium sp. SA39]KJQ53446.1 Glucose--fructose oxidoreductase precursor [Microbacterium sp. SA39]
MTQVSESDVLGVGLVGTSFMGRVHTQAWTLAPRAFDLALTPRVVAVAGQNPERTAAFAARHDIARASSDWRDLLDDPHVDVIDICVPGDLHAGIAEAALAAGKHVLCEKPLSNSLAEAESMVAAARSAREHGIQSMVGYSYRFVPALAHARELVRTGRLGKIRHVRAQYLQDWIVAEDFPLVWRLDRERAGSGALGDLGAHIVDAATFVTGHRLIGVSALTETFVTERPLPAESGALAATAGTGRGPVTVDDAAVFIGRTDGGALATFEATRFASGRKNAMRLEVNGSLGSISFDFENPNELWFHDHTVDESEAGFRRIHVTEPSHPFAGAWWPAGHGLGYDHAFVHEVVEFTRAIADRRTPDPSFEDGLAVQRVLDAVERSAAGQARWVPLDPRESDL